MPTLIARRVTHHSPCLLLLMVAAVMTLSCGCTRPSERAEEAPSPGESEAEAGLEPATPPDVQQPPEAVDEPVQEPAVEPLTGVAWRWTHAPWRDSSLTEGLGISPIAGREPRLAAERTATGLSVTKRAAPDDTDPIWQRDIELAGLTGDPVLAADPETLVVAAPTREGTWVAAMSTGSGELLWTTTVASEAAASPAPAQLLIEAERLLVFVRDPEAPAIHALDRDSGQHTHAGSPAATVVGDEPSRTDPQAPPADCELTVGSDHFVIVTPGGEARVDGFARQRRELRCVDAGEVIAAVTYNPGAAGAVVVVVEASDGSLVWSRALPRVLPIAHSRYKNSTRLRVEGDQVIVDGFESGTTLRHVLALDGGALLGWEEW